jgi:hypothetical protein
LGCESSAAYQCARVSDSWLALRFMCGGSVRTALIFNTRNPSSLLSQMAGKAKPLALRIINMYDEAFENKTQTIRWFLSSVLNLA